MGHAKFRHHPIPKEDELLSSWIVRIALAQDTDAATFVNLYLPKWKNTLWTEDIDVSAGKELIETLSCKSGFSREVIYALTLKSYEGYLSETITCHTRNPFIQSLGRYRRIKIKHGLRFCPLCLGNDKIPYFRRKWRLSFSTACSIHKCFLADRCPECGSSIMPNLNLRESEFNIVHCYKCGADLSTIVPEWIQEGSYGLWAIEKLYEILDSGMFIYAGGHIYSICFFEVLRLFAKIVYFRNRRKGVLDHEVMSQPIEFRAKEAREHYIEDIPLKQQYLLFSALFRLFEGFPGRLLSFCGANRIRGSDLSRDIKYIPFWYVPIIDAFNMKFYSVHQSEVKSAIKYLKKRRIPINKSTVGKALGICPDFKKRKDIIELIY